MLHPCVVTSTRFTLCGIRYSLNAGSMVPYPKRFLTTSFTKVEEGFRSDFTVQKYSNIKTGCEKVEVALFPGDANSLGPLLHPDEDWNNFQAFTEELYSEVKCHGSLDPTVLTKLFYTAIQADRPLDILHSVYYCIRKCVRLHQNLSICGPERSSCETESSVCEVHYRFAYYLYHRSRRHTISEESSKESLRLCIQILFVDAPQDKCPDYQHPRFLLLSLRVLSCFKTRFGTDESCTDSMIRWMSSGEPDPPHRILDYESASRSTQNANAVALELVVRLASNPAAATWTMIQGIGLAVRVASPKSNSAFFERYFLTKRFSLSNYEKMKKYLDTVLPFRYSLYMEEGIHAISLISRLIDDVHSEFQVLSNSDKTPNKIKSVASLSLRTAFMAPLVLRKAPRAETDHADPDFGYSLAAWFANSLVESVSAVRSLEHSAEKWEEHAQAVINSLQKLLLIAQEGQNIGKQNANVEEGLWYVVLDGILRGVFPLVPKEYPQAGRNSAGHSVLRHLVLPFYTQRLWKSPTLNQFVEILVEWGEHRPALEVFRYVQSLPVRRNSVEGRPVLSLAACAWLIRQCCVADGDLGTAKEILTYMLSALVETDVMDSEAEKWYHWVKMEGLPLIGQTEKKQLPT